MGFFFFPIGNNHFCRKSFLFKFNTPKKAHNLEVYGLMN